MCVANLNVAQSCTHRWYRLLRACNPQTDLSNCQARIRLEGWENKHEACPWCTEVGDQRIHESTHRLFGNASSDSSDASVSTPTSPEISGMVKGAMLRQRSSSSGSSVPTLSRVGSACSLESDRGQRNREMNDRLSRYLMSEPHELLPSGRKHYPGSTQSPADDSSASDGASTRGGSVKGWKSSLRLNKGMFKG